MPWKLTSTIIVIRKHKQFNWKKSIAIRISIKILCNAPLYNTQMHKSYLNSSIRSKGWSFLAVEKLKQMIKVLRKSSSAGFIHRIIFSWHLINRGTKIIWIENKKHRWRKHKSNQQRSSNNFQAALFIFRRLSKSPAWKTQISDSKTKI